MKIGILTYHRPCNFGANLQAYATSHYLLSLGHDAKVIDFVRKMDTSYKKLVPESQYLAHQEFVDRQLPLTRQVQTEEELAQVVAEEHFDLILVGADAVWSASKDYRIFFGCWLLENEGMLRSIRIASISPAFMIGFGPFSTVQKNVIRKSLERFSSITVRDQWTKEVINRDIFGGLQFVKDTAPDPVFMLDSLASGWAWDSHGLQPQKYVLMTMPTTWLRSKHFKKRRLSWFNAFKKEINKAGLQLVELPLPEGVSGLPFDSSIPLPITPQQWYLSIKNARAFCGMRFHAIVSCMAAGVPFYSLDTYCRRPKWALPLDILGLHAMARSFDKTSKICNLLTGSPFEGNRTGGNLEFESPKKVARMLLECDTRPIASFSSGKKEEFATAIAAALNASPATT